MDQYKLGAKFCRESHKSGGVSIFVHDALQCTNINLDEFCKEQDIEAYTIYMIKFSASQPSQFWIPESLYTIFDVDLF